MRSNHSTSISIDDVLMEIEYEKEVDNGYRYDSDGHGLPPSLDIEIWSIHIGEIDVTELFFNHAPRIKEKIIESIMEQED